MPDEKLDAATVRRETETRLGGGEADFSYITEELVAADNARTADPEPFGLDEAAARTIWYGNNARYGSRTIGGVTYQGYWFENDCNGTQGGVCSKACTGFVTVSWHHQYLGKCPNGREKWSFTNG